MMKNQKVIRKIEHEVAEAFERIGVRSALVAVSGGADSVALLCACAHIAPRLGLRIEAANCNFHLRGDESDRDSAFTAVLCERLGVNIHQLDYNVEDYKATHPGISIEMACRELRYADFYSICSKEHLDCVAVAHNADDDIETMMLALLRGSGSRGLRGMEIYNGRVLRPLLGVSRQEIEDYLSAIGQDFITDSSNLTSDYRRNFIRRDILPLIETRWPGARKSLSRTLSIMKEESAIVEAHYQSQLNILSPDPATLMVYADGVTTGTIMRFLEPFGGNPSIADEIALSLDKDFSRRSWRLSDRYEAILERDRLIIADNDSKSEGPYIIWERIEMTPGLFTEIKSNRNNDIIYLPHGEEEYELRHPQIGDRMAPLGMKGSRLVSDIISDAKLDREAKDSVRVLVKKSDGKIIWVTGLKRSRYDLVDPDATWVYRCGCTGTPH